MARSDAVLQRLVALKRQAAEQSVLALQQRVRQAEAALGEAVARLDATDSEHLDFTLRKLAHQQGHIRKALADIEAQRRAVEETRSHLGEAETALRRALHAEERLAARRS